MQLNLIPAGSAAPLCPTSGGGALGSVYPAHPQPFALLPSSESGIFASSRRSGSLTPTGAGPLGDGLQWSTHLPQTGLPCSRRRGNRDGAIIRA
jgi:hypothetical protein